LVLALRKILIEGAPPPSSLLWKLSLGSLVTLAAGWTIFRALQRRFYDHL
jgi:ABC-type polysaccharide/polyol phosphate export permease